MKKKAYKFNKLVEIVRDQQKKEKRIILCHGVFDLLHIGHIKYFKEAKLMGDILVVTITPDHFVNKGTDRPVFNEMHRSEAIQALDVVDYVSINKWPTAIETIETLKPDFYVKGPDYKNHQNDLSGNITLEENAVNSIGGNIAFTSGITYSSSSLINHKIINLTDLQKEFLGDLKKKYSFNEIYEYINRLANLKVLLVGETIIDEYVFCDTIGKSGKEPVLVNQKINSEKYAGGILSIANCVSEFCNEGKILSYLGDRDNQKQFIKENLNLNIAIDPIIKSNSPTILKTRFIDNYTKIKTLGVYDINDNCLDENEEAKFHLKLTDCIDEYDIVIVLDYGHGLITPRIVKLLEKKSNYLAVNTQLNSFNLGYHTISKYTNVNYICVHEGELRHDFRNRKDTIEYLTKKLQEHINFDAITITQGNAGSIIYKDGKFLKCPAFAQKIIDRVGAGDTLLSISALCLAAKIPEDVTVFLGNLAAAETIASIGTENKISKVKLVKSVQTLLK